MANHQTVRFGALWPSTVFSINLNDDLRLKLRDSYSAVGNAVTLATGAIFTIDANTRVYVRNCDILVDGDKSVTLSL